MSNYRRLYANGGTYFFTVVTYRRQRFLCDEPCRHWLCEAIIYTRQRYPFKIDAWVLLPDHLHCVWRLPENDDDFSIRWNIIKKRFTQAAKSTLHQAEFMNKSSNYSALNILESNSFSYCRYKKIAEAILLHLISMDYHHGLSSYQIQTQTP